jgi:hypothetical protein
MRLGSRGETPGCIGRLGAGHRCRVAVKIELLTDRPPAPVRELIAERALISLVALGL